MLMLWRWSEKISWDFWVCEGPIISISQLLIIIKINIYEVWSLQNFFGLGGMKGMKIIGKAVAKGFIYIFDEADKNLI